MKRRLVTLAAVSMFALAFGAAPVAAAGSPLTRVTYQAADLSSEGPLCGYTFASGEVIVTFRTADAIVDPVTGEYLYIPAAHQTLRDVVATKDGAPYKVVGVEIYNDLKGHLTWKMMFIAQGGGIADSINVVFRAGRSFAPTAENPFNGALVVHENDSCHLYA